MILRLLTLAFTLSLASTASADVAPSRKKGCTVAQTESGGDAGAGLAVVAAGVALYVARRRLR